MAYVITDRYAGDTFHSADTLGKYAERALAGDDIIYADTVIVGPDRTELRPRHLSAPALLTFESFAQGMLVCHQAFMVSVDAPSITRCSKLRKVCREMDSIVGQITLAAPEFSANRTGDYTTP